MDKGVQATKLPRNQLPKLRCCDCSLYHSHTTPAFGTHPLLLCSMVYLADEKKYIDDAAEARKQRRNEQQRANETAEQS